MFLVCTSTGGTIWEPVLQTARQTRFSILSTPLRMVLIPSSTTDMIYDAGGNISEIYRSVGSDTLAFYSSYEYDYT